MNLLLVNVLVASSRLLLPNIALGGDKQRLSAWGPMLDGRLYVPTGGARALDCRAGIEEGDSASHEHRDCGVQVDGQ